MSWVPQGERRFTVSWRLRAIPLFQVAGKQW